MDSLESMNRDKKETAPYRAFAWETVCMCGNVWSPRAPATVGEWFCPMNVLLSSSSMTGGGTSSISVQVTQMVQEEGKVEVNPQNWQTVQSPSDSQGQMVSQTNLTQQQASYVAVTLLTTLIETVQPSPTDRKMCPNR